jgi:hypothetical protein
MYLLQSGLSTSPISFTQLLPYEDFKEEYNKILAKLNTISNLEDFYNLGVFQRNNWNNDDLVPYVRAALIEIPDYVLGMKKVYNPAMEFLPKAVKEARDGGKIPQVVTLSTLSSNANQEYIVYSWEKNMSELLTEKEMELSYSKRDKLFRERKKEMKKKGDFSYIQKGLFKKVKESDAEGSDPLLHSYTNSKGDLKQYFIYKMINAWGNSFSANEFYATGKPSVIDNRFLKTKETSDGPIINAFLKQETKKSKTRTGSTVTKTIYTAPTTAPVSGPGPETKINIYAGTGENAELSNFANRPTTYNTAAVEGFFGTPEGAFQAAKISYTENLTDEQKIDNSIIFEKLKSASGSQAKSLGRTIKGLNQSDWNNDSSDVMLDILIDSFR